MFKKYEDYHAALERIGLILVGNVPEEWKEIQADVELHPDDVVQTSHFYRPASDASKEQPLRIASGYEHLEFSDCFKQLAKLTSTPEKGLFKKCKFIMQGTGKYTAEYEY